MRTGRSAGLRERNRTRTGKSNLSKLCEHAVKRCPHRLRNVKWGAAVDSQEPDRAEGRRRGWPCVHMPKAHERSRARTLSNDDPSSFLGRLSFVWGRDSRGCPLLAALAVRRWLNAAVTTLSKNSNARDVALTPVRTFPGANSKKLGAPSRLSTVRRNEGVACGRPNEGKGSWYACRKPVRNSSLTLRKIHHHGCKSIRIPRIFSFSGTFARRPHFRHPSLRPHPRPRSTRFQNDRHQ